MGAVIRFEIHADNPARAADFYAALLGWRTAEVQGLGVEYYAVTHAPTWAPRWWAR